jgi:PAS domain S-box-containing protein
LKARYAVNDIALDATELANLETYWLAMARAGTLDELEEATLSGLVALTGLSIAYSSRREDKVWTFSSTIGLTGEIAGVAIPEADVPYAEQLNAGETICYESYDDMGPELAKQLRSVGLGALYAVPIMRDGVCVGGMAIGETTPTQFSLKDRTILRLFTSQFNTLAANRELTRSLETLAENVPEIVLRTEPNGWINWYNRRWYEFTGQTREEAAGWGWQTAHHPEDFLRVMEEWPKALATGMPIEIEFRLRRYDGIYHWFLARVEPVRNDKGAIISWYGSVANIEAQKQAIARTKRLADSLQEAFLPASMPERAGMRLDATYVSAESDTLVGGDWYDAFELDGRLWFSIGDVAGHGVTASSVAGRMRQTFYLLARQRLEPSRILLEMNRILCDQEPGIMVSTIVGYLDENTTTMTYANAGHPPAVVATPGAPAAFLALGGPPLGIVTDLNAHTETWRIERDAVVVLYTDGLTEYAHDVLAGETQLMRVVPTLVRSDAANPARELYDNLLQERSARDDVAVLVLQFSEITKRHDSTVHPGIVKEWRFHASDAKAAHVARREVAEFLRGVCGDGEATFQSELIIGELLANTVAHAPGLVHLVLEFDGETFDLVVRDSGPGLVFASPNLPDTFSETSRGLFLIDTLSQDVSLQILPSGGAELRVSLPLSLAE